MFNRRLSNPFAFFKATDKVRREYLESEGEFFVIDDADTTVLKAAVAKTYGIETSVVIIRRNLRTDRCTVPLDKLGLDAFDLMTGDALHEDPEEVWRFWDSLI